MRVCSTPVPLGRGLQTDTDWTEGRWQLAVPQLHASTIFGMGREAVWGSVGWMPREGDLSCANAQQRIHFLMWPGCLHVTAAPSNTALFTPH